MFWGEDELENAHAKAVTWKILYKLTTLRSKDTLKHLAESNYLLSNCNIEHNFEFGVHWRTYMLSDQ